MESPYRNTTLKDAPKDILERMASLERWSMLSPEERNALWRACGETNNQSAHSIHVIPAIAKLRHRLVTAMFHPDIKMAQLPYNATTELDYLLEENLYLDADVISETIRTIRPSIISLFNDNDVPVPPPKKIDRSLLIQDHNPNIASIYIRWMIKTDMPEVLSIENDCFKSPWVEELPWLEEDFIRCLRQRNCFGMVGEHDDRVISFMIYQLNKHQISVLKFAVSPKEHRRGVGTQMIQKLKGKVCDQRRNIIALDVGENNYAAHLFNRANGFRVENILGDLDDYPEDIYISKYRSKHNLRRRDKFHITNRVSRLAG